MPFANFINWIHRFIFRMVSSLWETVADVGYFSRFCFQTAMTCVRPPWRLRLIFAHAEILGLRGMPVAMITALFTGMVIMLQGGYQLSYFNAKQFAAAGSARALTQIMIPIFTALVVGARTSASIAAELGTMRVTEQIDAMEILDINSRSYLIAPRVIATTLMLPIITIYADVVGLLSGMVVGVFSLQISARYYWTLVYQYLLFSDVLSGLVKPIFFGATMGMCGCYFGFHAQGGAEGVGRATTRAVVFTLILIVLQEYFLSSWYIYIMEMISSPLS